MFNKTWLRFVFLGITGLFFLLYALEVDSFARVGGGRSSGFRGSRSYSSPSRSMPSSPSSPSRSYQPPSQPGGGIFGGGGFLRSMAGGIAGGFLGSMLFRGLGFAGGSGWGGGGGIGLFEIILLAVILYLVYRFIKRRREASLQTAYYQSSPAEARSSYQPSYDQDYGAAGAGDSDVQTGLRYIRQMDPSFDEARCEEASMDTFFKIQGAWAARDMSPVRSLLTDEMLRTLQGDADRLKAEKKINKLDNIAVRSTNIVEAWQESGKDFITVRFLANLVDYTVDESTDQVVAGSKIDPVKFEEYWTFVRPVGNNPWQLSAITQPQ